jgi:hypothetical protein
VQPILSVTCIQQIYCKSASITVCIYYFLFNVSLLIQTQKPISSCRFGDRLRVACCVTDFVFLISFLHPPFLYIFILFYFRPAHFLFCVMFPFHRNKNWIGLEVAYSASDCKMIVLQPIWNCLCFFYQRFVSFSDSFLYFIFSYFYC